MKIFYLFIVSIFFLSLMSCNKDDNHTHNEEELITTLIYTLQPTNSGTAVIMTFKDIDGDGGISPTINTTGSLKIGETYNGSMSVLNESVTPSKNITTEIAEEALSHQFFFDISNGLLGKMNITYDDKDSNNNPIGLKSKVVPITPGIGKLKITLRHEPNKAASGVASGNITNAGGETDIEVTFDLEVK